MAVLKQNIGILHMMAGALLEYETIDADEVNLLVQGGSLEDLKNLRETKREQVERDRKQVQEISEKVDKELPKKAAGTKPMGEPGPVTA